MAAENFALDLNLEYAMLPDDFAQHMESHAPALLEGLRFIESGGIANPTEGRQVGHYWLRAPELAPTAEIRDAIQDTHRDIKKFAEDVHSGAIKTPSGKTYTDLLIIGIGGSALGPQFVLKALEPANGHHLRVHFLDNTDPAGIEYTLKGIPLETCLTCTISKSGSTAETHNSLKIAQHYWEENNIPFAASAVTLTGRHSKLDRYAKEQQFMNTFPMWDWIGGRTSICSAVGLLPMALCGIDTDAFLDGAAEMDRLGRQKEQNPAMMLSLAWWILTKGNAKRAMVVLPYRDRLDLFSKYLQQLIMESLGKATHLDGTPAQQGLVVYGNKGSTDQHSYMQQVIEGTDNNFVCFIHAHQDNLLGQTCTTLNRTLTDGENTAGDFLTSFFLGTRQALFEQQRPSISITLDAVTPQRIGALVALFERAVSMYAGIASINAYDQPGVETGKTQAKKLLYWLNICLKQLQQTPEAMYTIDDLSHALDIPSALISSVEALLDYRHANAFEVNKSSSKHYQWRN